MIAKALTLRSTHIPALESTVASSEIRCGRKFRSRSGPLDAHLGLCGAQLDGRPAVVNTVGMDNRSRSLANRHIPMRCNKLAVLLGLFGSLAFAVGAQAAQEQMGPWTLVTDNSGRIVTMSYPSPPTGLGIVQMLELDIGANVTATQGRLAFKNGLKRDMTKEEVAYYYLQLQGSKTAWDYLATKNQVTRYTPATSTLPTHLTGKFIRVIIQTGTNFFGTLVIESARPGGFSLSVVGASGGPIRFENTVVQEVQVAK